jgi:hypothetical protein
VIERRGAEPPLIELWQPMSVLLPSRALSRMPPTSMLSTCDKRAPRLVCPQ